MPRYFVSPLPLPKSTSLANFPAITITPRQIRRTAKHNGGRCSRKEHRGGPKQEVGDGIYGPNEANRPRSIPRECRGIIQTRNAPRELYRCYSLSHGCSLGVWNTITRDAVPEHRHKWVQCADSSTQDLLAHMSDICEFIDRMASPALSSSSSLPVEQECKHESND